MSQRDRFIEVLYKRALLDESIVFLTVDFGAPALDIFREKLPGQCIHVGISEQNAIDLAAGLALSGKRVFVYGMAPFISLRCLEQIKMSLAQMSLPVCIISVGVGLGYADSGPTHYATEDLGALRSIINLDIVTLSSDELASKYVDYLLGGNFAKPIFLRMDREKINGFSECSNCNISDGFILKKKTGNASNTLVIAIGYALNLVKEVMVRETLNFDVIDWFHIKPFPEGLIDVIKKYDRVIYADEQTDGSGGFGYLLQSIHDKAPELLKKINFSKMGLGEQYFYDNGGRRYLHKTVGFSDDTLAQLISRGS